MIDWPDGSVKYYALTMWRNYIQTGDVCLSTNDAINQGKREIVRQLTADQQAFVVRLEELANECLTEKGKS